MNLRKLWRVGTGICLALMGILLYLIPAVGLARGPMERYELAFWLVVVVLWMFQSADPKSADFRRKAKGAFLILSGTALAIFGLWPQFAFGPPDPNDWLPLIPMAIADCGAIFVLWGLWLQLPDEDDRLRHVTA